MSGVISTVEAVLEAGLVAAPLAAKLWAMRDHVRRHGRVAVAFSGGVDSTFVLKVAFDALGAENVLAVTGVSGSVSAAELDDAKLFAGLIGARHVMIEPGEFEDPNYLANPTNRCYYCKTSLYSTMSGVMKERAIGVALNGTNMDDLGDFRPGLKAAEEFQVHSPCVEAGMSKLEVRELSRALGLPTHDKPAAPCLSSRVQYGESITIEKLRMIERAESFLRSLGMRECRVRHHHHLARIEAPSEWIERLSAPPLRDAIDFALREIGYHYVAIDLRGFRSGSMNEVVRLGLPSADRSSART